MPRWTTIAIGASLVAFVCAIVWKSGRGVSTTVPSGVDAGIESHADGVTRRDAGASVDPLLGMLFDIDAGASGSLEPGAEADLGNGLPKGSPKTVRFGVILVQYRGAQQAAQVTRSKDDALTLARSLAQAAKTDFKGQVSRGDQGSMEDAGRIPRGVLEPPVEFALFTLSRGDVSEPIDTPRGFWIVRRIE